MGFRRITSDRGFRAGLVGMALAFGLATHPTPASQAVSGPAAVGLRVQDALRILSRVPSGRAILQRAQTRLGLSADELPRLFRWGEVSRTDAVLTRHFVPGSGQERREREVTVYLRESQPLEDLVLDVAHELTHATGGPDWDPYDPNLTPGRYITAALEGEGGEVEALITECRVALELSRDYGMAARRCLRYREPGGVTVSRAKVLRDFYRVGRWRRELGRRLGSESRRLPLLSGDSPQLYSSTGRAPYPVALLREFEALNEAACANSRRRLASLSPEGPSGRAPAAEASDAQAEARLLDTRRFIARRCSPPAGG
jgi:hypothetical protein